MLQEESLDTVSVKIRQYDIDSPSSSCGAADVSMCAQKDINDSIN
jgi:hypothetical protein